MTSNWRKNDNYICSSFGCYNPWKVWYWHFESQWGIGGTM